MQRLVLSQRTDVLPLASQLFERALNKTFVRFRVRQLRGQHEVGTRKHGLQEVRGDDQNNMRAPRADRVEPGEDGVGSTVHVHGVRLGRRRAAAPAWVAMVTGTDMPRSGFLDIAEPTAPSSDNDTGRRHRVSVAMNIPAPAHGNYQQ